MEKNKWLFALMGGCQHYLAAQSEIGPPRPPGLGERVFHIAFQVLSRPPGYQIFQEVGPAREASKVSEYGPAFR